MLLISSQESKRKAHEQEERRRKLQEMRDSIADEGTPKRKPPVKPPRTYMQQEIDSEEVEGATGGSEEAVHDESGAVKNPLSDDSSENSHQVSIDPNVIGDVEDNGTVNGDEGKSSENVNLNTPRQEDEKVASKRLTGLMSDLKLSDESKDDDVFLDSESPDKNEADEIHDQDKEERKIETPEPDIVQSTKPRPSGLPPPRPVAPPRRKRTNKGPPPPRPPPPGSTSEPVSYVTYFQC